MAVTTRSQTTKNGSNDCAHDATRNPPGYRPDTSAVVNRDTARASAANQTSARSKGTKVCRALNPIISEEDRHKRAHNMSTVSNTETNPGSKPTRATKPRVTSGAPAVNKGHGAKPKTKGEESEASDNKRQRQPHVGVSSKRRTKRKRDDEDTSEADASSDRSRRRVDLPADSDRRREDAIIATRHMNAPGPSQQGLRRSARLASRASVQDQALTEEGSRPIIDPQRQCTQRRVREVSGSEVADTQRTPRRIKQEDEALSSPGIRTEHGERVRSTAEVRDDKPLISVKKEEETDQTWLLTANVGRDSPVESETSTPFLDRESTALRSPSVESAAIKTPSPRTGSGRVRIYQDEEALIPLGTIAEEAEEEEDAHDVSLPQLDGSSDSEADENDVENIVDVDDWRRSLGPEPDEGLLAEIRSGRIPGLASPER